MNRAEMLTVLLLGLCWSSTVAADDWPTEQVEMRGGQTYRGLIESVDEAWVHLIQIHRRRGRPMHLVIRPLERSAVKKLVRLDDARRAELRRRIDRFIHRVRIETARMQSVRLTLREAEENHYQHYRGKWFTLDSTTDETTTRRIIVRIEQIFTAYRQILPPRVEAQRPLRLVVFGSEEEYTAFLGRLGLDVPSGACFLRDMNVVVAAGELTRFAAQLAEVNQRHQQLREELEQLEAKMTTRLAELGRQLKQDGVARGQISRLLVREKRQFQDRIQRKRTELNRCDRENARMFDTVTRQMFVRLYHEALHAYLENYVYPHAEYDVPRWLSEGLAMVCQNGRVESGTLRIDAPMPEALTRLKADLRSDQRLPLGQLLTADAEAFAAHDTAERHYVYCWGLAYYLTFQTQLLGSQLLGTTALDQFVESAAESNSPVTRFEKLINMPLDKFEPIWREYVLDLQ